MVHLSLLFSDQVPVNLNEGTKTHGFESYVQVAKLPDTLCDKQVDCFASCLTSQSTSRQVLRCCLIRSMIASQPCSVDRLSSGTMSAIERNSDTPPRERNNFVPCLVGVTAVSCLHRFKEQSQGFNIFSGFVRPFSDLDHGPDLFTVFRGEGVVTPPVRSSCTQQRITRAGTSVLWCNTWSSGVWRNLSSLQKTNNAK